jgi:cap1 methyltransferase
MFEINCRLSQIGLGQTGSTTSEVDVNEIVPLSLMLRDEKFTEYLKESNNALGERQVIGLAKIAAFCKDPHLREDRQAEIKEQCLDFWKIPNEARRAPPQERPNVRAGRMLGEEIEVRCGNIECVG